MGEDKSGKSENRPALGNITNQLGKRGFSLISRSPPSKSKSCNSQNTDDTVSDSNFWKQVSLVVEKLENERSGSSAKCPKITNEVGLSPLRGGKTYRLLNTPVRSRKSLPDVSHETKEPSSSALDNIDLDAVNVGESLKESRVPEVKSGEDLRDCVEGGKEYQGEETRETPDVAEIGSTNEGLETRVVSDNGRDVGVECLTTSQSESAVSSRLNASQELKGFGLERCTALKGGDDGCSLDGGIDSLKNCSCSFCSKAGYIWSDLHYQDVKSRISIMVKSQKEASNLVQKYSVENEIGSHTQESFNNVAQLETDLTSHWRSLFLHMEDMFGSEGSQLQNNFLALKDLRDDYKMNLEMINGMPSDVQQCSSDGSDHTIV
ncbi:hypothetical protein SOVF_058040 [Spinacia oleracea]|uniref:Uncharacterized protein LOC110794592 n=1 Tax=Spinacia oleracea TaxID=3562 RepID=A0A9R0IU85_SPIOL|nr:uncharacterized protein LOC110794592 [Spinacia oleracea]XP_021855257.1 uncharacterized protein LOC110794592 [Spinacia oleracea]KNA19813.1 hypothetical protein SOVF_058040 [Spinacia oleracea]